MTDEKKDRAEDGRKAFFAMLGGIRMLDETFTKLAKRLDEHGDQNAELVLSLSELTQAIRQNNALQGEMMAHIRASMQQTAALRAQIAQGQAPPVPMAVPGAPPLDPIGMLGRQVVNGLNGFRRR